MPRDFLSDKQVRTAPPKDAPYQLNDGESLYCIVRPRADGGASKLWQFFFKWRGKTERLSLGTYPAVSLAEARRRRDQARTELNGDPPRHPVMEARRRDDDARAAEQAAAAEKTVRTLFDDWEAKYLSAHRKDRGAEARMTFECDVFPFVGDLKAKDLRRGHIAQLIDRVVSRGARRKANILLALLKQLFSQAVVRGFIDTNPTAEFRRSHAGGKESARNRALSVDEIRELAAKLPRCGLGEPHKAAICLLLATGVRVGELNKAEWKEFHGDTWLIPEDHTKTERPHLVHLSDFAKAQLEILKQYRRKNFVLTSSRKIDEPIEEKALSKAIRDRIRSKPLKGRSTTYVGALRLTGGDWSVHDLRRTMATRMGDLAILPHIVEKCLAHRMIGVMAVYNQQEYLPEREAAFHAWGNQLERLFNSAGNVVELSAKQRKRK